MPLKPRGPILNRRKLINRTLPLFQAPIVLCHGSIGTGKTTLIDQIIESITSRYLWINLDLCDNNEKSLFKYCNLLRMKLLKVNEDKSDTDYVGSEYNVLNQLLIDMNQQEENDYYFIIDNVHFIENERTIQFLLYFLKYKPDWLKVVLISDNQHIDWMGELIFEEYCKVLNNDILYFDVEEIDSMSRLYQLKLNKSVIHKIYTYTLGWPVLTTMIIKTIQKYPINIHENWEALINKSGIYMFIKEHVFDHWNREYVNELSQISLLDYFDAHICKCALGINDAPEIISYLFQQGMIVSTSENKLGNYQLGTCLRIFLNGKLEEESRQKGINQIIDYFLSIENNHLAVHYALKYRKTLILLKLIKNCGMQMIIDGEMVLFETCVNLFESEKVDLDHEVLGLIAQFYYAKGNYSKLFKYLNRADSFFGKENKYSIYRAIYRNINKYTRDNKDIENEVHLLIQKLIDQNITYPYLLAKDQKLIDKMTKRFDLAQDTLIKVTDFGKFKVSIKNTGEEISWRTKKGCELFAYMFYLQGEKIDRRSLLENLWTYEIPDNAVALLHNMLYNIRKTFSASGISNIIEYKDKRYTLDFSVIESDFQQRLMICKLIENEAIDELMHYKNQLRSYWGNYLETIDADWCRDLRDYFNKMYVKGCKMIADRLEKEYQFDLSIRYLRNAFFIDYYSEDLMKELLICYGKTGDLRQMKDNFEHYKKRLKEDLEIEPSDQIIELYKYCKNNFNGDGEKLNGRF